MLSGHLATRPHGPLSSPWPAASTSAADPRLLQDTSGRTPFGVARQLRRFDAALLLNPQTALEAIFDADAPGERSVGVPRLAQLAGEAAHKLLMAQVQELSRTAAAHRQRQEAEQQEGAESGQQQQRRQQASRDDAAAAGMPARGHATPPAASGGSPVSAASVSPQASGMPGCPPVATPLHRWRSIPSSLQWRAAERGRGAATAPRKAASCRALTPDQCADRRRLLLTSQSMGAVLLNGSGSAEFPAAVTHRLTAGTSTGTGTPRHNGLVAKGVSPPPSSPQLLAKTASGRSVAGAAGSRAAGAGRDARRGGAAGTATLRLDSQQQAPVDRRGAGAGNAAAAPCGMARLSRGNSRSSLARLAAPTASAAEPLLRQPPCLPLSADALARAAGPLPSPSVDVSRDCFPCAAAQSATCGCSQTNPAAPHGGIPSSPFLRHPLPCQQDPDTDDTPVATILPLRGVEDGSFSDTESFEARCGICLDEGDFILAQPCNHKICVACATELLLLHTHEAVPCPFCRRMVCGFVEHKAEE